jgi:integrase
VLRLTIIRRRVNRGLGSYPLVNIDKARNTAIDTRRAAREGRDLAQERRVQAAKSTTFRQAFDTFFENKRKELEGSRHLMQWTSQMRDYVFPKIGSKPVGDVTHADVIEVLEPIWYEKPETAKRVLHMTLVFESAILRGQREKANPCDGIAQELGPRHREVEHHRAMPFAEVPAFIRRLRGSKAKSALAFEWLILTATRSGETRLALWSEIDEQQKTWTIPAKRMKMKRAHVVPLSHRCFDILKAIRAERPPA